jgi:Kyakuja-Dileera-Zisupton transposase
MKLQDEQLLVPRALHAIDGNYSVKQAANSSLIDTHQFNSDYLMSCEYVNKFKNEVQRKTPENQDEVNAAFPCPSTKLISSSMEPFIKSPPTLC